jgi:hypothetical protein
MNVGAVTSSSSYAPPARVEAGAAPAASSATSALEVPAPAGTSTTGNSGDTTNLTPEALVLISKLKARDTEVRQHEQAHLAAAGGLAVSGAAYTYQRGPNGVDYAVGGEVHIDTAPGRTPEETIARAHTIQAAALAPSEPSGADRAVAAQAAQLEQQARADLAVQEAEKAVEQQAAPPAAPAKPDAKPAGNEQKNVRNAYDIAPLVPPKLDTYA